MSQFTDFRPKPTSTELVAERLDKIGPDGRCVCSCGDPCPLGRAGSTLRCTRAELENFKPPLEDKIKAWCLCEPKFRKPDWSNPVEWIVHPMCCLIMLPTMVFFGAIEGLASWVWNCQNSSSVHGSWRPFGNFFKN